MVWSLRRVDDDDDGLEELSRVLADDERFGDIDLREPPSQKWLATWCAQERLTPYWGVDTADNQRKVLVILVRDGGTPYFVFWQLQPNIALPALRSVLTEFAATVFADHGVEELLYYLEPEDEADRAHFTSAGFEQLESSGAELVLRLKRKRFMRR